MDKIKSFIESGNGKDILTVFIVVLVGLGSFGLGRMSKSTDDTNPGIKIKYTEPVYNQEASAIAPTVSNQPPKVENVPSKPKATSGAYFASSRGSKYYSLGCSGGKTLKPENKIYFNSKEEAESAGYELSSTCKQ